MIGQIRVANPDGGILSLRPIGEITAGRYRFELRFPLQRIVGLLTGKARWHLT
jgi:hypothetical protein